jgi:hypothetical protein
MIKISYLVICGGVLALAQTAPKSNRLTPSEELNAQLPRWLRLSGEYRARVEGFVNNGFGPHDDLYLLNRFRINMAIQPLSWVKLRFQGQDARVFWKNQRPPAPPFQDVMDLRLGWLELGDPEKGAWALRVGRQEFVYGEQRLVGHVSWLNTARSFDAARLTLRHNGYRVDAFASSVVIPKDGEFNRHIDGNNFHGLYGGVEKLIPKAVLEPYVFWRTAPWRLSPVPESGGRGKLSFATAGFRLAGKMEAWDYSVEMAKQFGSLGADSIRAWAGHWRLGYTTAQLGWKPRWIGEYNYATGDRDPRDGRRQTFDILYPTPHDKYGLSDQVGWKNIHHVRFGVDLKPHPKWLLQPNYHCWWLASRNDGLYLAGGALLARVAGGARSRHVGQELDFQATYTLNKQVQIAGGLAHIFPGAFLKEATPGKAYTFPYIMLGYAF